MTATLLPISVLLSCCLSLALDGVSDTSDHAVETGREALRARSGAPWYDAQQDTVRRIEVPPNQDDQRRHSQWAGEQPPATTQPGRSSSLFWRIMQVLAWIALGLLLALLVWFLVWAALRAGASDGEPERLTDAAGQAARMEDLPIGVSNMPTDLLAAARAGYEAGNYDQAVIYTYAHQLVELDKRQLIHLTKGKTNRQYLRELLERPRIAELLRDTMLAFEDVFFGHHSLSRERFQRCWDGLTEFHHLLEHATS